MNWFIDPLIRSFGGDSFNSAHLLQLAQIQNQFEDDSFGDLFEDDSVAQQFAEAVRGALISASASDLVERIFDTTNPGMNTITLDGSTVTFEQTGDRVIIRVNDGIQTNVLDVPIPQVN